MNICRTQLCDDDGNEIATIITVTSAVPVREVTIYGKRACANFFRKVKDLDPAANTVIAKYAGVTNSVLFTNDSFRSERTKDTIDGL